MRERAGSLREFLLLGIRPLPLHVRLNLFGLLLEVLALDICLPYCVVPLNRPFRGYGSRGLLPHGGVCTSGGLTLEPVRGGSLTRSWGLKPPAVTP